MIQNTSGRGILVLLLLSATLATARADSPGQADLDQATDAKIDANTPDDLQKVIDHLQAALDKGLDDENEKFAEQLMVSTLLERAEMYSRLIFDRSPPDQRWQQIRIRILNDVERALAIEENQPQGHFIKGRLLALPGGDREGAIESFGKVIDAAEGAVEETTRAEALIYRAELSTDAEKQLADYDRAVELVPNQVEIVRRRALFHLRQQRLDEAVADFRRAVELDSAHAGTREALGLALLAQEKLDEALDQFQKAAELAPEDVSPLVNQARVLGGQRDYAAALAVLDKALEVDPQSIPVLVMRAQVHVQNDDVEKALEDLDAVLRLNPNALEALLIKAEVLREAKRMDEAIDVLEQIVDRAPDNLPLVNQLAIYHLINENYEEAVRVFSSVLERDPENVAALRGRSDAYLSIGEHASAIADYEVALDLAPDDDQILNNLSWVLSTSPHDDLRDGNRALELAERACEVTDYQEAHILSTLAAAHAELGDFEKAREWSAKAVEIGKREAEEEKQAGEPGRAVEQLGQLEAELESYQQEKPWRELQEKQKKSDDKPSATPSQEIKPAPAATSEF